MSSKQRHDVSVGSQCLTPLATGRSSSLGSSLRADQHYRIERGSGGCADKIGTWNGLLVGGLYNIIYTSINTRLRRAQGDLLEIMAFAWRQQFVKPKSSDKRVAGMMQNAFFAASSIVHLGPKKSW